MIGKTRNTELFVNFTKAFKKRPAFVTFHYFNLYGFGVLSFGHINPFSCPGRVFETIQHFCTLEPQKCCTVPIFLVRNQTGAVLSLKNLLPETFRLLAAVGS